MLVAVVACNKDTGNTSSQQSGGGSSDSGSSGGGGDSSSGGSDSSGGSGSGGSSDSGSSSGSGSGGGGDSSGSSGGASANEGRTLNIAVGQDSGTLNPLRMTGGFAFVPFYYMDNLFSIMEDGSYKWCVAENIEEISEIHSTLYVRKGIKFSNGNPLTAEDVMFSMEQCAADPQFALNVKAVDFVNTKVIDEYTIDLWYTEFNAGQEPGFPSMVILDKESWDEAEMARNPVGSGPYIVTDYVINSHVTLEAKEDYWQGAPEVKRIVLKVINEEAQIVNALEVGEVDIASVPISEVDYVKSLGYNVSMGGGYNLVTLFSMLPGNPLDSKEARYAMCYAIDRQSIADILYNGLSTITDYPCSHMLLDFEERFLNMHDTYSIGYNPAKAKELAEQAGLVGKKIRIITNGSAIYNTTAEIVQSNLMDIGVDAEIVNYEQATYFPTMMDASNFEIAIFTPATPVYLACDTIGMYLTFISLGWSGPDRDEYGRLSMGALTTYDLEARRGLLYEALQYFVDFCPWYGVCEVVNASAMSKDVVVKARTFGGGYRVLDLGWAN